MGEAARAADAAAHAGHALDEVLLEEVFLLLEQRHTAGLDAVAGDGVDNEVALLLLEGLRHCVGQAAAARENAAEVAGVVQHIFRKGGQVEIAAVKPGLQFLEGEHAVDPRADLLALELLLLGCAGTDEDDLGVGVGALDEARHLGHGREVVADEGLEGGEALFDVADKGGAAAGGEEALFGELLGLGVGDHVRAKRRLHHAEEAQLLEARDHLTQLGIDKLAGDGGGDDGVDLVLLVALALTDNMDGIQKEALVLDGAEGALIDARAAGDALAVVDMRHMVFALLDGFDLARALAGAHVVLDGAVGADGGALTAVDALVGVDVRVVVVVKGDCAARAGAGAAVGDAAAAVGPHAVAADRALVAGDADDLDHVGVFLVPTHGDLHALGHDGALLVDAAAHGALGAGGDGLGDVQVAVLERPGIVVARDLLEHLVLELLNVGVE